MSREQSRNEPTFQRMILRLALVLGLLLIRVQPAAITRTTPQNTISLLALAAIPACGLIVIESLFERTAARISHKDTPAESRAGIHHAAR